MDSQPARKPAGRPGFFTKKARAKAGRPGFVESPAAGPQPIKAGPARPVSNTAPGSNRMWLQDFLPSDIRNIRIMTYGYNSTLVGPNTVNDGMLEYRRNLVHQLENARSSQEVTFVSLTPDLGGILILQHGVPKALLQAKSQAIHKKLLDTTQAILFFGTPHRGLRTEELEAMLEDMSCSPESNRADLLIQLREGSGFLETEADEVVEILGRCRVSSTSSKYERNGQLVEMVKKISAQLCLPNEHRVPVPHNHTNMVKFLSPSDGTYRTVITWIKECLDNIVEARSEVSGIVHMGDGRL
ncbi:hypothetical protein K440DRAFT_677005 [Wilcoxina mikolae CBS 423.85]|nr:hypothetical protein K440DRAFT_677005 [Wilcoxina mikolae CBS 423.85]